jgi:hypothetical protein
MMEKFDGIRVFWDGKVLRTAKSKQIIVLPKHIDFPASPFEGELW